MIASFSGRSAWLLTAAVLWAGPGFSQPAPRGVSLTNLYTFTGESDGAFPHSPLVRNQNDQNYLWGTTTGGGSDWGSYGCGTIFRLQVGAVLDLQTVYQFPGTDTTAPLCKPNSLTVTSTGHVYGTTRNGAVFEIVQTVSGHGANLLYAFSANDSLKGVLGTQNGGLIGVAQDGPGIGGCGYIFELHPRPGYESWAESVVYHFNHDTDGCNPDGNLTSYNGALYGVTIEGGAGNTYSYGTVFKLSVKDRALTVLHAFNASEGYPVEGVTFSPHTASTLYGVTYGGGTHGRGIVYSIKPDLSDSYTVIDNLSFGVGGAARPLVTAQDVVYGVTEGTRAGTSADYPRVFVLIPPKAAGNPWTEKSLATFSNGDCPSARLFPDGTRILGVTANDVLFDACYAQGVDTSGAVFEVVKQ
ncbi:MAG: choice-of-anchor tandem repeat GloVer-containing protein [Bryobacteraceae bacterium]